MASTAGDFVTHEDRAILQQLLTSKDDLVYVSGSRVEGLGNRYSDLDYFIVTPQDTDVFQQPVLQREYYIDCEYYSIDALKTLSETVRAASADPVAASELPLQDVDLYYRTAIGVPVIGGDALVDLTRGFDKALVSKVYASIAAKRARTYLISAKTDLWLGDRLLALFEARVAAEWATNFYLAERGEAYPNSKWRFEKAARHFGASSAEYARIWEVSNIGDRTVTSYVDAVNEYSAWCDVGRPLEPVSAKYILGLDRLRRVDGIKGGKVGDEIVLSTAEGSVYHLAATIAGLWDFLAKPRDVKQITERVCVGRRCSSAEEAVEMATVLLARMESHGLIERIATSAERERQ
jgi:hypothetical protein